MPFLTFFALNGTIFNLYRLLLLLSKLESLTTKGKQKVCAYILH